MAKKSVIFDEFHATALVSLPLNDSEAKRIRRTLSDRRFHAALLKAIRLVIKQYPTLRRVRVRLSR